MQPDEIKQWLSAEEYQLYLVHEKHGDGVSGLYLTIAECRRLMKAIIEIPGLVGRIPPELLRPLLQAIDTGRK